MAPTAVVAESVTALPHPGLARWVERYTGYRYLGFPPGVHRGLPSRRMTFIVSIGPTIDVDRHTDPGQTPGSYRAVLSGLQQSAALISHNGHQEGVAIDLTAEGCRALFGLPAAALWDTTVELSDVTGPLGDQLWERLQGAPDWSRRFAACDEVLGRLAGDSQRLPRELGAAWNLLVESGGAVEIGQVTRRIGWSRQHLGKRFRTEFGCSPKVAARVVRFERARTMLQSADARTTIASIAASCGYADQAHLTREFGALAGCSPSAWLAEEELPFVQDGPDPEGR